MNSLLLILRSGSILTNFFLAGYLIFLHEMLYDYFFFDSVLETSRDILLKNSRDYIFGIILLFVIIGETVAIYWKTRYQKLNRESGSAMLLLWIFHTVIGVIMGIFALEAVGLGLEESPGIASLMLIIIVIKELAIIGIIVTIPETHRISKVRRVTADILLALFYSLAYTVVIGNVLITKNYNHYLLAYWHSPVGVGLNLFIILLLFFMLYLPLRLAYFLETADSQGQRTLIWISICLVAALAILPLFEGEHSLKDALENPKETEMLFLNSRKLTSLPPDIGRLTNLRVLHLGFNGLKSLPPEFSNLKKLRWLNIAGNRFKKIPKAVLSLPSLRELDIHYNGIATFPKDLSSLKKLEKIHVRSNRLPKGEIERLRNFLGKEKVILK